MNIANLLLEVVFPAVSSLVGAVLFARYARIAGASGRCWIAAVSLHLVSTALALLILVHVLKSAMSRVAGDSYLPVDANHVVVFGVAWDFQIYAVLLIGGLLAYLAARCATCALGVALGAPAARTWAVRQLLLLLALTIPLIPLQPAAVAMAACLLPVLGLVKLARPARARQRASQVPAVSGVAPR